MRELVVTSAIAIVGLRAWNTRERGAGRVAPPVVAAACCGLALALGVSGTAQAQHGRPPMVYEVVSISAKDLQIFPGEEESEARDVNNLGEVVGWSTTSTGNTHAFTRALLGSTIDLGAAYPSDDTVAEGINDNSEVVGHRQAGAHKRAFYWSAVAGFLNLSNANPRGVEEARDYVATAINSYGRIVGAALENAGLYDCDAVTWWYRSADPSLIYTPPAGSKAYISDISDSGWFAGIEKDPATGERGFRYRVGTVEYPLDPSPAEPSERVYAVNEGGTVVGGSRFSSFGMRAIRWRLTGNPLVLGLLPGGQESMAFDINETEFVVGSDFRVMDHHLFERAFLFHYDFGMIELPPPAWTGDPIVPRCHANRLNDRKENGLVQAVGYCMHYGKKQAVRWDVFVSEHAQ